MKKLSSLITLLLLSAAPLFAAPAAITDLTIDEAATGFRHVGLTWTVPYDAGASAAAAYYELRVSTFRPIANDADWNGNSGLTSSPYRVKWSTAAAVAGARDTFVVTGLANGQTYFFALRSSTDNSNWSSIDSNPTRPFKAPFNSPPMLVDVHNYADGAVVPTQTPTLAWSAPSTGSNDALYGDSITSYTVEVSRYLDFSQKIEVTGLTSTSWITPPLLENTSYYWRVKAGDAENLFSTAYEDQIGIYFYVNGVSEAPTAFDLSDPVNSQIVSTTTPVLQWSSSADPDPGDSVTYTLYYSTMSGFSVSMTTTQAGISSLQQKPSFDLIENATYYWKVYAVGSVSGSTMSSSTGTFRVNAQNSAPLAFTLTAPADAGSVLVSTPTLAWNDAVDPDPGDVVSYSVLYTSSDPNVPENFTAVNGLPVPQYITPPLQEDTTYWWKVQAADTHFGIVESARSSFYVDAVHSAPAAFHLLASSGIIHIARPTFTWEAVAEPEAVTYTVVYSTYADFSISLSSAGLAAASFTPTADLNENTTYWWKVRADNSYGLWCFSQETWAIAINIVPEPPQAFDLLSPADGTPVTSLTPGIDWQNSSEPDPGEYISSYLLYYSTAADFSTAVHTVSIAYSSCTISPALASDATYYWKVVALSNLGEGTTSQHSWRFITRNQPPDSFNISSPSGLVSTTTISFSWVTSFDPENEPVTYTLYYSTDAAFGVFTASAGITATHCSLPSFGENKTYYWYVEAVDQWDHRRASVQVLNFSVNAEAEPPAVFGLTSPADGARVTTIFPLFSWQNAVEPDPGDTVSYILWYSRDPSFASKTTVSGITATSYQLTAGLSLNTTYYWRIYAAGSDGLQRPSSTRSFLVEERLTLAAPAGFSAALSGNRQSVALHWDAVTKQMDGSVLATAPGYRIYKAYDFNSLFNVSPTVSLSTGTLTWTDTDIRSLPVFYLVRAYALSGDEGSLSVTQRVDTENTTYSYTDDRSLTVAYPPEVLASSASVVITRNNAEENGAVLRSYQIGIRYNDGNAGGTSFIQPLTLTFNLSGAASSAIRKAAGTSPGNYAVYWFNGVEWVSLGGQVNGDEISVKSPYAGRYQVRSLSRAAGFSVLKAWPKIMTPNDDGSNDEFNFTFENPAGERVDGKLFDLTGRRIGRMASRSDAWLSWNGRDDEGNKVPPGIYLYQVDCGGTIYNGTVVVAR